MDGTSLWRGCLPCSSLGTLNSILDYLPLLIHSLPPVHLLRLFIIQFPFESCNPCCHRVAKGGQHVAVYAVLFVQLNHVF